MRIWNGCVTLSWIGPVGRDFRPADFWTLSDLYQDLCVIVAKSPDHGERDAVAHSVLGSPVLVALSD
jgi:hypothetical protein